MTNDSLAPIIIYLLCKYEKLKKQLALSKANYPNRTYVTGTLRSPFSSTQVLLNPRTESFVFGIETALVKHY